MFSKLDGLTRFPAPLLPEPKQVLDGECQLQQAPLMQQMYDSPEHTIKEIADTLRISPQPAGRLGCVVTWRWFG